jgi:hypothetical protein
MKIGVVVGASGHSEDSTVTTMSPIPSSDASTNSNTNPFSVGWRTAPMPASCRLQPELVNLVLGQRGRSEPVRYKPGSPGRHAAVIVLLQG